MLLDNSPVSVPGSDLISSTLKTLKLFSKAAFQESWFIIYIPVQNRPS